METGVNFEHLLIYLQKINAVQEDERTQIARELHDVTIQSLVALLHQSERFLDENPQFEMSHLRFYLSQQEQIKSIIQELRYLSMNLRPRIVDHLGLFPSISHILGSLKNYGISAEFKRKGSSFRFSPEVELTVFRIVQEAINNIIKHSQASEAVITITNKGDQILIILEDNGIGCQDFAQELPALLQQNKLGILGMIERAKMIGGDIQWSMLNGRGTVITLSIPIVDGILRPVEHSAQTALSEWNKVLA